MRCVGPRLLGAVLLLGLLVVPAGGQPGGGRATPFARPLVYHELVYLGDPVLHAELKLTPEQVKKVGAFRESWFVGALTFTTRTTRTRATTEAKIKSGEQFLAEALDADQRARLRQITLQQLASWSAGQIPTTVLADLKLTAEQRAALTTRGRTLDRVLTAEQRQAWRKLIGSPFAKTLVRQVPEAARDTAAERSSLSAGRSITAQPLSARILRQPAVRKTLELTEVQSQAIDAAYQQALADQADGSAAATAASAAFDKVVAGILQPKQKALFDRMLVRSQTGSLGEVEQYLDSRVAGILGVGDEQRKRLAEIGAAYRQGLTTLLLSGEPAARLEPRIMALRTETLAKLDAVLTAEQRDRRKALLGTPVVTLFPTGFTSLPQVVLTRELATYLNAPELPAALKLTAEQAAKRAELAARYRTMVLGSLTGDARTTPTDVLATLEKELVALLGAEKRARFRQIVLQQLEQPAVIRTSRTRTSRTSMWNCQDIVEPLHLTAEQVAKLSGGAAARDVLTEPQQKKWQEMKGEAYSGTLTSAVTGIATDRTRTRTPVVPARFRYLEAPAIHTELKLTAAQIAEVDRMQAKWRQLTAGAPIWTDGERPGKLAAATEQLEGELKRILQPAQVKRYEQVLNQQLFFFASRITGSPGTSLLAPSTFRVARQGGLLELLTYPPTAKAIGLSAEQQRQTTEIVDNHVQTGRLISSHLGTGARSDETTTRATAALREQTEKQLAKVLTDQQREVARDLVGEPFTGTIQLRSGFRGGAGGPGGGGRGGALGGGGGPPPAPRQP